MSSHHNFSYVVDDYNMDNGTITVTFTPDNVNLSPVSLNCNLILKDQTEILNANGDPAYATNEEIPLLEHIKQTAIEFAPHNTWDRQDKMLDNENVIMNANGSVTV